MRKDADKDFATGKKINAAHPEEIVRQEYEKILHHDLGYPKACMDIGVAIQMGSSVRECDIAVYQDAAKREIIGIVETKAPGAAGAGGMAQLESYMSATGTCRWGVWTNGDEIKFASKNPKTGKTQWNPAFSVPRHGELDAGIKKFSDLRPASNLKWVFRLINNRLYANTNLPRTEKQGAEMVRFIFCKLTDEGDIKQTNAAPEFQIKLNEDSANTRARINKLWKKTKRRGIGKRIFEDSEEILIDDYSLQLIVGQLQGYSFLQTDRDIVGDAFEVFSERQFAGEKGQFFTPRAVVKMIVDMIGPTQDQEIVDPACGSGGFLIAALDYITEGKLGGDKRVIAENCLFGIDKDSDLAKICKAHMSIIGDGKSNIVTDDSLENKERWQDKTKSLFLNREKEIRKFDVLITNPPFGSKIRVEKPHILERYDLGHKWRRRGDNWEKTGQTKPTPPQVLFIERCLALLKDGGYMGIVLPDGLLGNPGDGYIRQWLQSQAKILAVIDCPLETFAPHTSTKTSVIILRKLRGESDRQGEVFFAIAEHCGHTLRGKDIVHEGGQIKEDFSRIAKNYHDRSSGQQSHLGFMEAKLRDGILVPRYYDPRIVGEINKLKNASNADMVSIGELAGRGDLQVSGVAQSVTSEEYDIHGEVRFIRTSDICGYELAENTQKMVSHETYRQYREKQDLRLMDILFVKDGDNRIGETAMLLDERDLRVLVQTHFKKIRAININPFLLLWLLNQEIVKKQVRQRVFSQSTLSTIGERINELFLPLPAAQNDRDKIIREVSNLVSARRANLRKLQGLMSPGGQ